MYEGQNRGIPKDPWDILTTVTDFPQTKLCMTPALTAMGINGGSEKDRSRGSSRVGSMKTYSGPSPAEDYGRVIRRHRM